MGRPRRGRSSKRSIRGARRRRRPPRPRVAVAWSGSDKSPAAAATGELPTRPARRRESAAVAAVGAGTPPERPTIAVPTTPSAALARTLHGVDGGGCPRRRARRAHRRRTPGRAMTPKAGRALRARRPPLASSSPSTRRGAARAAAATPSPTAWAPPPPTTRAPSTGRVPVVRRRLWRLAQPRVPRAAPRRLHRRRQRRRRRREVARARGCCRTPRSRSRSARSPPPPSPTLADAAAAAECREGRSGAAARKLIAHVGKAFRKRKVKAEHKPCRREPPSSPCSHHGAAAASRVAAQLGSTASTASAPPRSVGM